MTIRFYIDGKEISEVEFLRRKFCLCGEKITEPYPMCAACLIKLRQFMRDRGYGEIDDLRQGIAKAFGQLGEPT